jgi:hypothetical protein
MSVCEEGSVSSTAKGFWGVENEDVVAVVVVLLSSGVDPEGPRALWDTNEEGEWIELNVESEAELSDFVERNGGRPDFRCC